MIEKFRQVRADSITMCEPLLDEDYRIQPIADVSPPWWNLGHTSWFFVRNILEPFAGPPTDQDQLFDYVLNSYYASLGERIPRDRRGLVTRPSNRDVYDYRKSVDQRVRTLLESASDDTLEDVAPVLKIGLEHERQHQELFFSEIKCIYFQNPPRLRPVYRGQADAAPSGSSTVVGMSFRGFPAGSYEIGNVEGDWGWDNELPVHRSHLSAFELADRPVVCGEYLEFVEDGGYDQQLLWLDNGWYTAAQQGWRGPLYWERVEGRWQMFTLAGMREIDPAEPVCHLSFFEADAFARWKALNFADFRGVRLPTEKEWELACRTVGNPHAPSEELNLLRNCNGPLHPQRCRLDGTNSTNSTSSSMPQAEPSMKQLMGDVWEWTSSYYEAYPGYRPFGGALVEYNSKFMDNQRVLRGGSCFTECDHARISYRNFWAPATRFQMTGVRLARDV